MTPNDAKTYADGVLDGLAFAAETIEHTVPLAAQHLGPEINLHDWHMMFRAFCIAVTAIREREAAHAVTWTVQP